MDCTNTSPEQVELFYKRFRLNAVTNRVPVSGSIELTQSCNLSCLHCYHQGCPPGNGDLTYDQWFDIIDQIVAAGTLFLLITGGEPLLRKDFVEIYTYAIKKGLIVTVFTNGSLITDELIDLFCEFPPRTIEISVYGSCESVYRKVTGSSGVYRKCLANIEKLKKNNIRIQLKSVFIKENIDDFVAIRSLAERLDLPFRFDAAITPALQGDQTPLNHRVSPEQAVLLNLSSDELRSQWKRRTEDLQNVSMPEQLYSCGAAMTSYYIDSRGWLYPCMMVSEIKYFLLDGDFQTGWFEDLPRIWDKKNDPNNKCISCKNRVFCDYCPATFQLETGSETTVSEFLCKVGSLTSKKLYAND